MNKISGSFDSDKKEEMKNRIKLRMPNEMIKSKCMLKSSVSSSIILNSCERWRFVRFLFIIFSLYSSKQSFSQISEGASGFILAKEYSKEIALYNAKTFAVNEVLGVSKEIIQFYIDPLAAASSGELTTLVYSCQTKDKEGLILGFYGNRWNSEGTHYQAFAFKDLPRIKADELIDKIENAFSQNKDFINDKFDKNNIYFSYDDLTMLVYNDAFATKLRIYWNGFDSEWEWSAFRKTKKRFIRKLK